VCSKYKQHVTQTSGHTEECYSDQLHNVLLEKRANPLSALGREEEILNILLLEIRDVACFGNYWDKRTVGAVL
jgi:hypothetical protein